MFHEEPVEEHFVDCNSPCDFLWSFLMKKLEKILFFKLICIYNKSKRANQYSLGKKGISMALLEINLLMGYHKLPSWLDYWKCNPHLSVPFVSSVISRLRFGQILLNFQLRPLIASLKENFIKLYDASRYLSVDKSMILFKRQSSIKQHNRKKKQ